MATIVDGKQIASNILTKLKKEIKGLGLKPHLAVVLVGDDPASKTYIRKKQEAAAEIGVKFSLHHFPSTIPTPDLISEIQSIQKQDLSGIIVQLPLPANFDKKQILNELDPEIDVDCLSWVSLGRLVVGENFFIPPSPAAIFEILKHYNVPLPSAHVVLVGAGDLVGKPLANLLVHKPITLTVCNHQTKNLPAFTKQADILITAAGKAHLIRGDMVKKGVVVIDAGVSFRGRKMYGDVNFAEVVKKASLITPTPGGVGPITVAKLLENTVAIAKVKSKR